MRKRAFIIHGWEGHPGEGWLSWLRAELAKRGLEVHVPAMPETSKPKIEVWVPFLSKLVGKPDENTYFVGHSIGCQTILRYFESIDEKVGGAILVAGWVHLVNLEDETAEEIAQSWLETPMDWQKIKNKTTNFVAFFSDNDEWVPITDAEIFKEKLGAKIIIEKGQGHFTEDDKVYEIPTVLEELLKIT